MGLQTLFGFLRGINVGGHKAVSMGDLRALAADLGLANPRTVLQSGNLVFESNKVEEDLERQLENDAKKRLGIEISFFVRSARTLGEIVRANPFHREAESGPGHLLVLLLKEKIPGTRFGELQKAIAGREALSGHGTYAFIYYPDGIGASKLTNQLIERKLGVRATARNWNTILRLHAMAE